MSIWWSLHLRREAASVPLARRLLLGTMESAGVDPDVSYDLSIALSEACANAVEHGGDTALDGGSEAYRVTAYLDGETCRIEVADSGPGFGGTGRGARPAALEALESTAAIESAEAMESENGRGLYLIQELADHVHIGNKPGQRGAVVSFDKILKWRKGVAPLLAV
jgi:serine/threonine-protein kinase RsbW